jgi:ABC-type nitrate/sulfonate/bicarbonate transport system substrate-binding protein
MTRTIRRVTPAVTVVVVAAIALAACGSDNSLSSPANSAQAPSTTAAAPSSTAAGSSTSAGQATTTTDPGISASGISKERCEKNKAAGPITYLTSFDFAAAASILDVVVAKDRGYFDDVCLNVTLKPGFSTSNYALVAAGQAQLSSAGAFTELLNFSTGGAKFVAVADYGKTPVEALLVRDDGKIRTLQDLKGKTIGVKGDIPPSIVAMLAQAGLKRGVDYKEVLLDGFDPVAHLKTSIDALPVYKSNEPGQLDRAGVKYKLFDPIVYGVPGSFGIIYTTPDFLSKHPTAVQDFVRAAFKGYSDAVRDPASAVTISIKEINAAGNQNYLTQDGETYRWQQESAIVGRGSPADGNVGLVDPTRFQNEVDSYAKAGVFSGAPPMTDGTYDPSLASHLYQNGALVWPAS